MLTIVLKPKELSTTFNTKQGITHFYQNGSSISIDPNSIVYEDTKQVFTGDVNLYSYAITGSNEDMANNFPGDFSALNNNGGSTSLFTHGIQKVELYSTDGRKLNLAENKKAKMTFPVPGVLQGQTPQQFPIWHFNTTNGLWEETGTAILKGNMYETEVSHFSTVNIDYPSPSAQIIVTVLDCDNKPLAGVTVELLSSQRTTGETGTATFNGVPTTMSPNIQSGILISAKGLLNGFLTSNTITINNLQPNENRNVTINLQATTLTGRLVDCNNNPLTGIVTASWGQQGFSYGYTDANGTFNISIPPNSQVRISYPAGKSQTISVPNGCNVFSVGEIKIDPLGNNCQNDGGGGSGGSCSLVWNYAGQTFNANDYRYQGQIICAIYQDGSLVIRGLVSDKAGEGLSIQANIGEKGTYEIGRPQQEPANIILIMPGGEQFVSYYIDSSAESAQGELIIEEFTSSSIKGRFTCQLYNPITSTKVGILNGNFSLSH